jgi:hypothetical protein
VNTTTFAWLACLTGPVCGRHKALPHGMHQCKAFPEGKHRLTCLKHPVELTWLDATSSALRLHGSKAQMLLCSAHPTEVKEAGIALETAQGAIVNPSAPFQAPRKLQSKPLKNVQDDVHSNQTHAYVNTAHTIVWHIRMQSQSTAVQHTQPNIWCMPDIICLHERQQLAARVSSCDK